MKIKKLADLNRIVPITIIAGGVAHEVDGTAISARRMEDIERLTPMPAVPREKNAEGEMIEKADDPAYVAAQNQAWQKRMLAVIGATLGADFFGTDDMAAQAEMLQEQITPEQILSVFRQIRTSATVVRKDVEDAKDEIRPTAATSAAAETSA